MNSEPSPWWLPVIVAIIPTIPAIISAVQSRRNNKKLREVNHAIRDNAQATTSLVDAITNDKNGR